MHFGTLPWTTWHAVLILDLQDTQWGQTFYFLIPIIFYIFSEHMAIIWKAWEVEKRMENRKGGPDKPSFSIPKTSNKRSRIDHN